MRSLSARKDGTALVIGAIPPNQNYFLVTANLEFSEIFDVYPIGFYDKTVKVRL